MLAAAIVLRTRATTLIALVVVVVVVVVGVVVVVARGLAPKVCFLCATSDDCAGIVAPVTETAVPT